MAIATHEGRRAGELLDIHGPGGAEHHGSAPETDDPVAASGQDRSHVA